MTMTSANDSPILIQNGSGGQFVLDRRMKMRIDEWLCHQNRQPDASVDVRALAEHFQRTYTYVYYHGFDSQKFFRCICSDCFRKKHQALCTRIEHCLRAQNIPVLSSNTKRRREERRQARKSAALENGEDSDDCVEYPMTAPNTKSSLVKRARLMASAPRAMAAMSGRQNTDFIDSLFDSTDGTPSVPVTTFADVGGCTNQLEAIHELCKHLADPSDYVRLRVRPPCGLLLHGPPGCGKSLVARAVAGVSWDVLLNRLTFMTQELRVPLIALAAPQLVGGVSGESETRIRQLFTVAKTHAPCIVFLDEIDAVCGKRDEAQKSMESRIVAQLLHELDGLFLRDFMYSLIFIFAQNYILGLHQWMWMASHNGTCLLSAQPHESILSTHRFDELVDSMKRSVSDSGWYRHRLCPNHKTKRISQTNSVVPFTGLGIPDERARTGILTLIVRDLCLGADVDCAQLAKLTPGCVGADLVALTRKACMRAVRRPSALREGFATVPNVQWEDVGALSDVRHALQWSILYPVRYATRFAAFGLNVTGQGVLLCGPPGCGKTLLAKAVANESGMNFLSVKGPELLNMSTSRIVNQLLTEMDGVGSRAGVYLMAATNRPGMLWEICEIRENLIYPNADMIDPAILRPGRLDKRFGADLAALVREASVAALREQLFGNNNEHGAPEVEDNTVHHKHFVHAVSVVRPSVDKKQRDMYERLRVTCSV
ncbi:unnamed protein product [Sphagnum balticum]